MFVDLKSSLNLSCSKFSETLSGIFACFSIPKIKNRYFLYTFVLCIYIYIMNGIQHMPVPSYLPVLLKRTFHCACDSKKVIETIMKSAFLNGKTPPNPMREGRKIRERRITGCPNCPDQLLITRVCGPPDIHSFYHYI
jgi:hypothetical protein